MFLLMIAVEMLYLGKHFLFYRCKCEEKLAKKGPLSIKAKILLI